MLALGLTLTRAALLVALGASSALAVHYLHPATAGFCGVRSGCEAVRQSALATFGGSPVSLPQVALLVFAGLLLLSFKAPEPARTAEQSANPFHPVRLWHEAPLTLLFAIAFVGAVIGLQLIAYQVFGIGQVCVWCLIVDSSAIVAAVAAFFAARATRVDKSQRSLAVTPPKTALGLPSWGVLTALAVGAPPLWAAVQPDSAAPPAIRALYQPGMLNIVEVSDFECPFCRRLHTMLAPLLAALPEPAHLVRAHVPLAQHRFARPAARAALCAEEQGKGEVMADRLFRETLNQETLERLPEQLGLEPLAYADCLRAARIEARLAQDYALVADDPELGLPTLFVGNQRFVGVPSRALLEEALVRGRQPAAWRPSAAQFCGALGLLVAVVVVWGGRRTVRASGRPPHAPDSVAN
jgi:protein-disulfide isomerase